MSEATMFSLTTWILGRTYNPRAGEANIGMAGAYQIYGKYLAACEPPVQVEKEK